MGMRVVWRFPVEDDFPPGTFIGPEYECTEGAAPQVGDWLFFAEAPGLTFIVTGRWMVFGAAEEPVLHVLMTRRPAEPAA